MTAKKIVIIGATGGQGGSVVNSFLNHPEWRVLGITRNPSSQKSKNLETRGVEVVQADLDDRVSLAKAFQDANVIFAVSDFWSIYNDPKNQNKPKPGQALNEWTKAQETPQLKNIIDEASRVSSLERFIMSSLPGPSKLSGGKYTNVCHHDSKADAEEYGEQNHPKLWAKASVYLPGYFLSNFLTHPMAQPTKKENRNIQFANNLDLDAKVPLISHDQDSGPFVRALIQNPPGKSVVGYRAWITPREFVRIFSQVTGYKTELLQVPPGELPFDCVEELGPELQDNFAFANEIGLHGGDDSPAVHPNELNPSPQLGSVEDWIREQDWPKGINVTLPIIFFDRQGMSTSRNNRTIVNVLAKKFALQRSRMEPPRKQKLVVVASNNIPKIKATRDGFTQMLPDSHDFQSISVDSNVSDQPFSDEETLRGATNRAQNAQAARSEADFWVGIEGGVETHNGSICSFAWIVVIGKDGKVGKARTSAYFLPDKTCQLLKEGVELGHADDMVFGQIDSKNKQGSVGLLTGGVVDRAAYYTQAVILALIPFRNASLDF
ncbi:nitrogen metabolic regulation nmr [Fusarium circinatum]|uniref:inosine/xanthosine triphosphatase n=1 Tax=Fusarium circinatum TaxID=48490 RepID=A0A8H5X7Q4_FUSCI|nr:nitrogen metabolic regulation nmr [Fusarium circinatum]